MSNASSSSSASKESVNRSLPLALLIIGLFFLWGGLRIEPQGVLGKFDPGPRVFPLTIAAVLIAGSVLEFIPLLRGGGLRSADRGPAHAAPGHPTSELGAESSTTGPALISSDSRTPPTRPWLCRENVDVGFLLITLVVYAALLPWMGFNVSTVLFSTALMLRLGTRWWLAVIAAIVLVVLMQLLFNQAFGVPLPRGSLFG